MDKLININRPLIESCKRGDARAQFMLYKQYSKAMYNIAIRFLNNRMDAEDILQESFVTAFEKISELSNENAFGSWLKRIVVNNCITHIRKNKVLFEDLDGYEHTLGNVEDEDFDIEPEVVHDAIKELPDGGRTILILYALEKYKHREIAEMLSISESTSKSQYRRALDILYHNLKSKINVSQARGISI
jgi:RNA polymerase sigma factor (sigma-70 family)